MIINERQSRVLLLLARRDRINLRRYRRMCPCFSNETLRRDLAGLVRMGLLQRHGKKRTTYYTSTFQQYQQNKELTKCRTRNSLEKY